MLHKIIAHKQKEVAQLDIRLSEKIKSGLAGSDRHISFYERLIHSPRPVSVIAEVKKASPSRGVIRPDFNPLDIARQYREAGVDAMSVLTDSHFFQGNNQYLNDIRKAHDIPVLRKDFIIDERQIYESKLIGADCILLIASILKADQLHSFYHQAQNLEMDVLVEIHDEADLERTLSVISPQILGINNRDLKTFKTSITHTEKIMNRIPTQFLEQSVIVSESGIHTPDHIQYLKEIGVRAVLVGEYFMRQKDIRKAVLDLVG
ncbi:MAG: indole-3-glycerol phosphate synthase TrpC [Bacillaceae bacterium]|nr:indole-3-glycerol phosphate synthase TrpC [Bacillaceae bacterium]